MNFIYKLERKYGKFGIKNLTLYIMICYVIGFALDILFPSILPFLTLNPYYILQGQVWRLVSWLLIPPSGASIFVIIMLLFYYSIGTSLERAWGSFRYTLYIFSGIIFTILAAFLLFILTGDASTSVSYQFSTYYISMSIFLAFAATYPDMQVLLYFVIPIKVKWLAYVNVALLLYSAFTGIRQGTWAVLYVIVASLLNFILFFLGTRNIKRFHPKEVRRKKEFTHAVSKSRAENATHKCTICGQTNLDNPDLEFRFCSKCKGNHEYCQEHLFTHQHIK
ncbi:MAG: hypothetical protein ACK5MN_08770 [Lachnospiraceae bacterium]